MADSKDFDMDPIPFDNTEPGSAPSPSPAKPQQDDMFANPVGRQPQPAAPSRIQTFGTAGPIKSSKDTLNRPLNQAGAGASRVRTFHAKLNDGAMSFLDQQINEWLDAHPEIFVKFATTTVGVVEGKRVEPHLIINVWH